MSEYRDHPLHGAGEEDHGHHGCDGEGDEQDVVVREDHAECADGADVTDEARGEDELAQVGLVETRLDHHGIDDGDRCGRKRDPRDLAGVPLPLKDVPREGPRAGEWKEEADPSDDQAWLEESPERVGVDLSAGEKGQEDRAEAGQEVDPLVGRDMEQVSRDDADDDLHQRDRQADADRDHARRQGQADPDAGDHVDVVEVGPTDIRERRWHDGLLPNGSGRAYQPHGAGETHRLEGH